MKTRNVVLIVLLGLGWIVCLGVTLITALLGTGTILIHHSVSINPTPFPTRYTSPTPSPVPQDTPLSPENTPTIPNPTPTPVPTMTIRVDVLEKMDQIQQEVIELRGLHPTDPVERMILTTEGLRQHILDRFQEDYSPSEAKDDVRVLALLGLVEPDYDLWTMYVDLYSEQIAGFYDDELNQMTIISDGNFGGLERLTYAHEYAHALQDQNYDLQDGLNLNDASCEENAERCAAVTALIEGDAVLVQEQWLRTYASPEDIADILDFYGTYESEVLSSAPNYLQQDLAFPYIYGQIFVQRQYLKDGWSTVDGIYVNPPQSTEQIMHPERYPNDTPIWLEIPELIPGLEAGWRELDRNVLGEWYTKLVLEEYLPDDKAEDAAEGWGGDAYIVLYNDELDTSILILITEWDTIGDAQEAHTAFQDYAEMRYGPPEETEAGSIWHSRKESFITDRNSNQTLWLLAPNDELAWSLRNAIAFPTSSP